jgi:hypothetical protein
MPHSGQEPTVCGRLEISSPKATSSSLEREIKDKAILSALLFPTPGNFLNSLISISIASGYTKFIFSYNYS